MDQEENTELKDLNEIDWSEYENNRYPIGDYTPNLSEEYF